MRRSANTRGGTQTEIRLEQVKDIGKGAFGKVKKMKMRNKEGNRDESRLVAVKNPTKTTRTRLDVTEKDLLAMLRHKNIVDLLYYYHEGETVNVVLELVEGGDLWEMIHANWRRKSGIGIFAELFVYQLFRGLAYIHSKNVCHRDIKPENLLVNEKTGALKIADFGLGTLMTDDEDIDGHHFYVGTRYYRAIEMLLGCRQYSTNIDVWAGGIVLTQVLLGKPIFYEKGMKHQKELVAKIFTFLGPPSQRDFSAMKVRPIPLPSSLPRKKILSEFSNVYVRNRKLLKHLLNNIFVYDMSRRFTAWDVCNHRLFDLLKEKDRKLPNGYPLPDLFDFSKHELASMPDYIRQQLVPKT